MRNGNEWGRWKPKRGRKLTLEEVGRALEAHDRAQAASDRLRDAAGLPHVPDNSVVRAWRERLANGPAPRKSTTADDPMAEIVKAVQARKRAESRVLAAVHAAKNAGVPVSSMSNELGMTRQGVYAMLAR